MKNRTQARRNTTAAAKTPQRQIRPRSERAGGSPAEHDAWCRLQLRKMAADRARQFVAAYYFTLTQNRLSYETALESLEQFYPLLDGNPYFTRLHRALKAMCDAESAISRLRAHTDKMEDIAEGERLFGNRYDQEVREGLIWLRYHLDWVRKQPYEEAIAQWKGIYGLVKHNPRLSDYARQIKAILDGNTALLDTHGGTVKAN